MEATKIYAEKLFHEPMELLVYKLNPPRIYITPIDQDNDSFWVASEEDIVRYNIDVASGIDYIDQPHAIEVEYYPYFATDYGHHKSIKSLVSIIEDMGYSVVKSETVEVSRDTIPVSHCKWLRKNWEQFYRNVKGHDITRIPDTISAHGDKLTRLEDMCKEEHVPFHKVSAIGLVMWYDDEYGIDSSIFEEHCIKLFHEHPEWYEGCVDINPD